MPENFWLLEDLETVKNITDTVVLLKNVGKEKLIPTQLELLYLKVQELVDDFCVDDTDAVR